jgi:hypothetical protein
MKSPSKSPEELSKDERLAAALRENLKRRKAQARAKEDQVHDAAKDKEKTPSR